MHKILRLIDASLFVMDEDEIRQFCTDGTIGVYFDLLRKGKINIKEIEATKWSEIISNNDTNQTS